MNLDAKSWASSKFEGTLTGHRVIDQKSKIKGILDVVLKFLASFTCLEFISQIHQST